MQPMALLAGKAPSILIGAFDAFYNFDEAANNANAHDWIGAADLVQSGNPVRAAAFGSIPFCKTFNNSTPNYYTLGAPNVFSMGDIDYSFCGWVYGDAANFASQMRVFGKGTSKTEYVLSLTQSGGNDVLAWRVYDADGTTANSILSSTGPALGQKWIWFACNHKASANTFQLRVECPAAAFSYNSGPQATTVTPGLVFNETYIQGVAGDLSSFALKGFQTSFGMKKNTALTTAQENAHYNLGLGVTAPTF